MVLDGRLAPGERLNEVLIANDLGMSRGPLREAIQTLVSEGLLTVVAHKGAFVRSISESELRDLYELRTAIESHAVRVGVNRATPAQLAGLRSMLDSTRAVLEDYSQDGYPTDKDFHAQLVALSHSATIIQASRDVNSTISLARARSGHDSVRARAAYEEHDLIVAALAQGDAELATQRVREHLSASVNNFLALDFGSPPATDPPATVGISA